MNVNEAILISRQRRWQIERKKLGLCTKCGRTAFVFKLGKRAGTSSVYCSFHLIELREKNRARAKGKNGLKTVTIWPQEMPLRFELPKKFVEPQTCGHLNKFAV